MVLKIFHYRLIPFKKHRHEIFQKIMQHETISKFINNEIVNTSVTILQLAMRNSYNLKLNTFKLHRETLLECQLD